MMIEWNGAFDGSQMLWLLVAYFDRGRELKRTAEALHNHLAQLTYPSDEARGRGLAVTPMLRFPSMAVYGGKNVLADIKVVAAGYPLRGEVRIPRASRMEHRMWRQGGLRGLYGAYSVRRRA